MEIFPEFHNPHLERVLQCHTVRSKVERGHFKRIRYSLNGGVVKHSPNAEWQWVNGPQISVWGYRFWSHSLAPQQHIVEPFEGRSLPAARAEFPHQITFWMTSLILKDTRPCFTRSSLMPTTSGEEGNNPLCQLDPCLPLGSCCRSRAESLTLPDVALSAKTTNIRCQQIYKWLYLLAVLWTGMYFIPFPNLFRNTENS